MFLGSRSYQTSVSVWMFRETNHFHASKFPCGSGVRFFFGSQVQVAPKEDYEPLLFLEPVRQTRCFLLVGCPNNRKLDGGFKYFFVLNPGLWGNDSISPICFKWAWNHQLEKLSNGGGDGLIESEKSLWKKWWVGWICFVSVMRVEKILRAWNPTS